MAKLTFYLRHVVRLCILNPVRFWLSVLGLAVGLLVLAAGNVLVESYYAEALAEADQAAPNVVALTYRAGSEIDLSAIAAGATSALQTVTAASPSRVYAQNYVSGRTCTLTATLEGISAMSGIAPALSSTGEFILMETTVLRGRLITASDIAQRSRVAVIDQFTADLLFPDGDPIGGVITLGVELRGTAIASTLENALPSERVAVAVVGVIANSRLADRQRADYNKFLSGAGGSVNLTTVIYLPISVVSESLEPSDTRLAAWSSRVPDDLSRVKVKLETLRSQSFVEFAYYDVQDRQSVLDDARDQLGPMRAFLTVIVFGLLLVSGVNAMATMFFAVKERIPEIGVKKALGATGIDIMTQFMLEGMFIGFVAGIGAAAVGVLVAAATQVYLTERVYVVFHLRLTPGELVLPVLVGVAYGFVFSLLPSIYGASIKVTESLRFE